jgi:hypothetical protein
MPRVGAGQARPSSIPSARDSCTGAIARYAGAKNVDAISTRGALLRGQREQPRSLNPNAGLLEPLDERARELHSARCLLLRRLSRGSGRTESGVIRKPNGFCGHSPRPERSKTGAVWRTQSLAKRGSIPHACFCRRYTTPPSGMQRLPHWVACSPTCSSLRSQIPCRERHQGRWGERAADCSLGLAALQRVGERARSCPPSVPCSAKGRPGAKPR